MSLSGKANRYLKTLGHQLNPIVMVGKEGVTDGVIAAMEQALLDHELVKVRVGTESPEGRKESAKALAAATDAALVQILGRTALLYKAHPKKPKITLPRG